MRFIVVSCFIDLENKGSRVSCDLPFIDVDFCNKGGISDDRWKSSRQRGCNAEK